MIGVLFRYDEIASELRAMAELAGSEFLEPGSDEQLKAAARQIEQLSRARGVQPWAIHRPVKTRTTAVRGGHNVHAEIKWIWELTAANHRRTHFALRGKTSTRIDIVRHVSRRSENLLSWTMEMGDAGSPGAHFHVQIKNVPPGDNESEFDVPRIPGILCTPAEHLDFVLGELFQKKWERRQQSFFANQHAGVRECQRRRLANVFGHLRDGVRMRGATSSAWMTLKAWKPNDLILAGDSTL